jgi:hypothetical protein
MTVAQEDSQFESAGAGMRVDGSEPVAGTAGSIGEGPASAGSSPPSWGRGTYWSPKIVLKDLENRGLLSYEGKHKLGPQSSPALGRRDPGDNSPLLTGYDGFECSEPLSFTPLRADVRDVLLKPEKLVALGRLVQTGDGSFFRNPFHDPDSEPPQTGIARKVLEQIEQEAHAVELAVVVLGRLLTAAPDPTLAPTILDAWRAGEPIYANFSREEIERTFGFMPTPEQWEELAVRYPAPAHRLSAVELGIRRMTLEGRSIRQIEQRLRSEGFTVSKSGVSRTQQDLRRSGLLPLR